MGDENSVEEKTSSEEITSGGSSGTTGIQGAFGPLKLDDVIDEKELGRLFNRSQESVKRAIRIGHLPPSEPLLVAKRWTVRHILKHFERRLERAAKEVENTVRRFEKNRP